MRSTAGRPAPRSRRVGKTSANTFTPLCAAMRAAARRPGSRSACPPRSKAALPPARPACVIAWAMVWAMACTVASSAASGLGGGGGGQGTPPSPHDTSAGNISVATWPGRPRAAVMASAASWHSAAVLCDVRTKPGDTLRATVSMSLCSCASYCVWCVAWSPTMLTTGTLPLRALCRLARPLPRPQPRCNSVAAGLSAMRA